MARAMPLLLVAALLCLGATIASAAKEVLVGGRQLGWTNRARSRIAHARTR
jgi:hypothetical protein